MKELFSSILFFIFCYVQLAAQEVKIGAIPYPLYLENSGLDFQIIANNQIQLTAGEKTDLFISPDGGFKINNSPRLLFRPDSCFIFTSKIELDFNANWDAGVLLIYNDSSHFAKFCFESDFKGTPRIVTVVCNQAGDDCNSFEIKDKYVYFRIIGETGRNSFKFFYSSNAETWYPVRTFKLDRINNLQIGFIAQSPTGKGCAVNFSEIELLQKRPTNWWEGK
jgi:uncharacterized protein